MEIVLAVVVVFVEVLSVVVLLLVFVLVVIVVLLVLVVVVVVQIVWASTGTKVLAVPPAHLLKIPQIVLKMRWICLGGNK